MKKALAVVVVVVGVLVYSLCFAGAKDIKDAEYNDEVAKSRIPVVLMFWDYYCIDCKESGPAIDALADEYAGKVKVLTMNATENKDAAAKYDTKKLPVYYYIKEGQIVGSATGLMTSKEELVKKLGLPGK
jgi:thioredoxin 1